MKGLWVKDSDLWESKRRVHSSDEVSGTIRYGGSIYDENLCTFSLVPGATQMIFFCFDGLLKGKRRGARVGVKFTWRRGRNSSVIGR